MRVRSLCMISRAKCSSNALAEDMATDYRRQRNLLTCSNERDRGAMMQPVSFSIFTDSVS
jgi:hypothetical protein